VLFGIVACLGQTFVDAGGYMFCCSYMMVAFTEDVLKDGVWLCVWKEGAFIQLDVDVKVL